MAQKLLKEQSFAVRHKKSLTPKTFNELTSKVADWKTSFLIFLYSVEFGSHE